MKGILRGKTGIDLLFGIFFFSLGWGAFLSPALAADTLILNKGHNSVISGTVLSVQRETLILENNDKEIRVELDNMDLDTPATSLFEPGMEVSVEGRFEDLGATPEFKAIKIVRNSGNGLTGPEAFLLEDD